MNHHHVSKSGNPAKHILVVDDDPTVQRMITSYFGENNLAVASVSGRQEMAGHFAAFDPRLVILDMRLGRDNGLDLLREIKSRSDVPVIITTGHWLEEIDRVVGLELGAEDYVAKPFFLRELLARVRAVLRRVEGERWTASPDDGASRDDGKKGYLFKDWRLDLHSWRLLDPAGVRVALTKNEYALLLAFLSAPQRPLTRAHLVQAMRVHEDIRDRSIDVQVLRLRRKLESDPAAPVFIRTERGVGYVFTQTVERL
jgi:two-component system, OmpR family, response regulator